MLKNGRAKAMRGTTLAALCEALECQPGDLPRWKPAEDRADDAVPGDTAAPTPELEPQDSVSLRRFSGLTPDELIESAHGPAPRLTISR